MNLVRFVELFAVILKPFEVVPRWILVTHRFDDRLALFVGSMFSDVFVMNV
jgi:hypothetical protein